MTEQAKVPAIRFAGFTDPWEQRKLSELLLERDEQAPQSDQYPLMAFIANQGIAPKGDRYDRSALVNDIEGKPYKRTEKGDFIYSSNNLETGSIGLNKYGNACISPVYSIFQPSGIADSDFLGRRLVRKDFIQEMVKWRQGVIYGQWRIHEADFLRLNIAVPSVDEQRLIGKLLDNLDSLITLHQRKYDKLVIFKKSMLEKMFPKDGESVPEIRFAGFTDPWEQRKLGDYVVVSTAKNADGRFNKEDVLSVSGEYGIVNQIAFQGRSFAGSSVLNYGIVNTGDIVYTKSPLNSNPYGIIKVNKGIPGIVSTLYAVYRPQDNVHTNFIQVYFEQHERMNNYMHPLVNKGAKNDMKVTAENALKGVVTFPSREEQVIISEFFDRLDSLITLHQRKLELLQNIKKSLLDKMFV